MQGYETDESADVEAPQDVEAVARPHRVVPWVTVVALGAVLLTVAVGSAVLVAGNGRPEPAAAPASTSPLIPPVPDPEVRAPLPEVRTALPDVPGDTVAEVVANGEAVGATVVVVDARWDRPVGPDWRVCTRGEGFVGSTMAPSGQLHVSAVPQGDPCP